jgi:hypothetical protein
VALSAHSAQEVAPLLRRLLDGDFAPGEPVYERFDERYHHRLDGGASGRIADVVERLSRERDV